MTRWSKFWTWYVLRFWVTYHTPAPLRTERYYAWPMFVRGSFRHHHKTGVA